MRRITKIITSPNRKFVSLSTKTFGGSLLIYSVYHGQKYFSNKRQIVKKEVERFEETKSNTSDTMVGLLNDCASFDKETLDKLISLKFTTINCRDLEQIIGKNKTFVVAGVDHLVPKIDIARRTYHILIPTDNLLSENPGTFRIFDMFAIVQIPDLESVHIGMFDGKIQFIVKNVDFLAAVDGITVGKWIDSQQTPESKEWFKDKWQNPEYPLDRYGDFNERHKLHSSIEKFLEETQK